MGEREAPVAAQVTTRCRVVLDTNAVLSALLFAEGRLAWLRRAWQEGRVEPLVSKATVTELVRALAYPKFRLSADEQRELLADYLPHCRAVDAASLPRVPPCRDPNDTAFLQLAIAGKAQFLVTGDKDLRVLAGRFACPIVTPEELRAAIDRGRG